MADAPAERTCAFIKGGGSPGRWPGSEPWGDLGPEGIGEPRVAGVAGVKAVGGARARVDEVAVLEVRSVRREDDGGFRVEATWAVCGSVNHFGHIHYRQNRYEAALHIVNLEGTWKITAIELTDEKRIL